MLQQRAVAQSVAQFSRFIFIPKYGYRCHIWDNTSVGQQKRKPAKAVVFRSTAKLGYLFQVFLLFIEDLPLVSCTG